MSRHFTIQLQAETLRHIEEAAGAPERNAALEAQAIAAAPDFSGRIQARARLFDARFGITRELDRSGQRLRSAALLVLVFGFIAGIAAAQILPAGFPARANVITVLLLLLLPHTFALLLWLGVTVGGAIGATPPAAATWIGRRALDLYRSLAHRTDGSIVARAAAQAWWEVLTQTPAGRHRLACVAHGFWLMLLVGSLLSSWWLLIVRQVDFFWGSTLLGTTDMQTLLGSLTRAIAVFGLPVPSTEDIAASSIGAAANDADLRRRWGMFLLGALAILGVLPRLAALLWDLVLGWWRCQHLRLDLRFPGYARLRSVLLPVPTSREVLDPDLTPPAQAIPKTADVHPVAPPPGAAWIGLDWLPEPLPPADSAIMLGAIVTREDRQRVLAQIAAGNSWPAICVTADLATTPDRGVAQLLDTLREQARVPLHLVVVASPRAASMPDSDRQTRRDDWRALAQHIGLAPEQVHLPEPSR